MKAITISLSPNCEKDDVSLAFKELISPWNWRRGKTEPFADALSTLFLTEDVYLYNSGRSALYELLQALSIGKGDEVIVQSFTCVAVPNSVLWNGAVPVYSDIDESYNMSIKSIQKVFTKKTRAIIVQHTFGIPADIDTIVSFAHSHGVLVIEDCAHSLGASYKGKLLGTWGDAAFFSFGRDKVISSVFGGALILHNKDNRQDIQTAAVSLEKRLKKLQMPSFFWMFQQIFHPVAFSFILPVYHWKLGKLLLVLLQKLKLLSFPVYPVEKDTKQPDIFPSRYPPVLTRLALHQLEKLDRFNTNRKNIAALYRKSLSSISGITLPPEKEGAMYMRFPIMVNNPKEVLASAKKQHIYLGNWYQSVIDPKGVSFSKVLYSPSDCPKAEHAARHVVNLPTRISIEQAERIISFLKNVVL